MIDEPAIPALASYTQPHTRSWSDKIKRADAVVFVTPQYNWGYPAVLKNAIDHLYHEWHDKPVVIVSYGGHGGTKCPEQLKQIASAVKMCVVAPMLAITLPEAVLSQHAVFHPARDSQSCVASLQKAFGDMAAPPHPNNHPVFTSH